MKKADVSVWWMIAFNLIKGGKKVGLYRVNFF
jgi:hypothetical protein